MPVGKNTELQQTLEATATLRNGKIEFTGDQNTIDEVKSLRLRLYGEVYPNFYDIPEGDEDLWMEACEQTFQGMAFRAELIEEDEAED